MRLPLYFFNDIRLGFFAQTAIPYRFETFRFTALRLLLIFFFFFELQGHFKLIFSFLKGGGKVESYVLSERFFCCNLRGF